ncbi:hypothetical protein [Vibrio sp. B181a]|uniref:hypothetical protein n=1 Tax=Vibrio sp. B181a TaxID=2835906 RepID=UPI002555D487|nr:hypothetical protein [Vibrio sp. B181a]MDK9774687.1 hypothetical protein [Vibrio sp. B181a]
MKKLLVAAAVSSILMGCGGSDGGAVDEKPLIPLEPSEPVDPPLTDLEPSTPIPSEENPNVGEGGEQPDMGVKDTVQLISELTNYSMDQLQMICEYEDAKCEWNDGNPSIEFPSRTGHNHAFTYYPVTNDVYAISNFSYLASNEFMDAAFERLTSAGQFMCKPNPYGGDNICSEAVINGSKPLTAINHHVEDDELVSHITFAHIKPDANVVSRVINGDYNELIFFTGVAYSYTDKRDGVKSTYYYKSPVNLHYGYGEGNGEGAMVDFIYHVASQAQ